MKILIICPDWFPHTTGFGTSCYEFAKRAEKEHKVTIITPRIKNIEKKGLNIVQVPKLVNLLGRSPIVTGLLKTIKKQEYDVILLYSYMHEMNARVAIWRKMGIIKKPVILMYRGSLEDDVLKHLRFSTKIAKKIYDKTYGKAIFKYSDFIISNSLPTIKSMEKKYEVQKNKTCYIPNSININEYRQSKLNNKRILFVGRLIENKGVKFFDKIAKNIPKDWKFTIVGDGPLESTIISLKEKYKNIEYLGKLPKAEINKIYTRSDLLVLPTFAEGSPRVMIEACASGVPTVAFDVGDIGTVMNKNSNGFAIPRYDMDIFLKKMKQLIENKELRKKMGASAKKYAENNLDWEKNHKKLVEQIKNTIVKLKK